ncbi:hypothetical protein MJH12_14760, partial [bacterium]|nr:hypothetical protein [bacterium]
VVAAAAVVVVEWRQARAVRRIVLRDLMLMMMIQMMMFQMMMILIQKILLKQRLGLEFGACNIFDLYTNWY